MLLCIWEKFYEIMVCSFLLKQWRWNFKIKMNFILKVLYKLTYLMFNLKILYAGSILVSIKKSNI